MKGRGGLSSRCPRSMWRTRRCLPLRCSCSKNLTIPTLSSSIKFIKPKKQSIWLLRSARGENSSTLSFRKSVWPSPRRQLSWDRSFQRSPICTITMFVIEIWNLKIFYWRRKKTFSASNSLILGLPRFLSRNSSKTSLREPLCIWHLRWLVESMANKSIIGLVESSSISFFAGSLLFSAKILLPSSWA